MYDERARFTVPRNQVDLVATAKPCLTCQRPTRNGPRCPTCNQSHQQQREQRRGTAHQRGYGYRWQQASAYVIKRDGGVCRYCGGVATTADHVIPKRRGGTDEPSNLVASCVPCNSSKGAR